MPPISISLQPSPRMVPPKYSDRKSTRLNSSHSQISYAVFCLKKKKSDVAARADDSSQLLLDDNHKVLDEFAAGSYNQGSTLGSVSDYIGEMMRADLRDRAHVL